jgi:4-amino-4-deoxy-L-arabinose transferase-like glycosyltransferase
MRRFLQPDRPLTAVLVLGAIWLAATLGNLHKAFHIDDAAYLEIAQWVARHPLHPMQGMINWNGSDPHPIADINQPPLWPYCIAGWSALFGQGEASLHLLESLFALAAIVFFYMLARRVAPRSALLASVLFALSPLLVVGQNVMTDVPMVALWNAFYFVMLAWRPRSEATRYGVAGALAGTAILIKYTSLVLLAAMALHMILARRRRHWPWLLVPLAMLGGWSLWNAWDYGRAHVLDRPVGDKPFGERLRMAIDWLVCLGAIMPQAMIFYAGALARLSRRVRRVALALLGMAFAAAFAIPPAYHFELASKFMSIRVLGVLFLANGVTLAWMTLKRSWRWAATRAPRGQGARRDGRDAQDSPGGENSLGAREEWVAQGMLSYWAWSSAAFVVLFAPFMATRHVLPALPAMLLVLAKPTLGLAPRAWRLAGVAATALLTCCLALADWQFADAYRQAAFDIARRLPPGKTAWFAGHWGWQYYARQAGMRQLTGSRPEARPGDILARPMLVQQQPVAMSLRTRERTRFQIMPSWTFLPSVDRAGFYATTLPLLPWHVSRDPYDVFVIEEVIGNDAP